MTPDELTALVDEVLPVLRAGAAETDRLAAFPVKSLEALRQHRLMSLLVPAEFGGAGASLKTFLDLAQRLATACLSTAQVWAMHCAHVDVIRQYGSAELKARILPRIAAEQLFLASVTTEKGRGASLFTAHSPLTAVDGRLALDRSAPVVTGGAHADGFVITMRSAPSATEHEVTLIYADRDDLSVETAGDWDTLGMRGTESLAAHLTGDVPAGNVIGEAGRFADIARENMIPMSHLGWSACWLGAAQGALGAFLRCVAGTPAAEGDLFNDRLAAIRVDLELVSAYLTRVRQEVDQTRAAGGSLAHPRTQLQLNTLKVVASDLTFRAVDNLMKLAGLRLGYAKGSPIPIERSFRDARAASLMHSNDSIRVGIGALALLDRGVHLI